MKIDNLADTVGGQPEAKTKKGIYLGFRDYELISEILESIDLKPEERKLLWKVETIKHNMKMARLRKES